MSSVGGGGGGGGAVKRKPHAAAAESDVPGTRAIMYRLESLAEAAPLVHPQRAGSGCSPLYRTFLTKETRV